MNDKTYAFISYYHLDAIIAHEIERQLTFLAKQGVGAGSLECFLDTESIPPGQRYEPIIKGALEKTDWLIVIFTGDQSVYCGFEIGIYSILKPQDDKPQKEKPVICLHDVDKSKLPAVLEGYNTTFISKVGPYVANDTMSGQEVARVYIPRTIALTQTSTPSTSPMRPGPFLTPSRSPARKTKSRKRRFKRVLRSSSILRLKASRSAFPKTPFCWGPAGPSAFSVSICRSRSMEIRRPRSPGGS